MLGILFFHCTELCKVMQIFWPMSEACEITQAVSVFFSYQINLLFCDGGNKEYQF